MSVQTNSVQFSDGIVRREILPWATGTGYRPAHLRIGHYVFVIEWYGKDKELQDGKLGWCHPDTLTLGFAEEQKREMLVDTFIHEVLHALLWYTNLQKQPEEERLVTGLATALCLFWHQNPEACAWWQEVMRAKASVSWEEPLRRASVSREEPE